MNGKDINQAILLNSGRNCLKFIVTAFQIRELQIPYYICPVVRQVLREENVKINYYHIDNNFMPLQNFRKDEYILYPNYFGICSEQNKILSEKYPNLISDNAHSFYSETAGIASFYSPRKFFGVNDGGILFCKGKYYENFPTDDDRNIEINDFNSFLKNELSIDNQPIKQMSLKTKNILQSIDFEEKKDSRTKNFQKIHNALKSFNELNLSVSENDVPYVYPFLTEKPNEIASFLDSKGIYLIKYGSNLPGSFPEYKLSEKLLLLPLTKKINNLSEEIVDICR